MSVVITVTPGSPVATSSACVIKVTGLTLNDDTSYDASHYPSEDEVRYYITTELDSVVLGKSQVFACDSAGEFSGFFNYIFPEAGSWTVRVSNASTDASVQTQAVTVS